MNLKLLALGATAALALASQAQALNFSFSFTGDPSQGLTGAVNGVIYGLSADNGFSAATNVEVTSYDPGITGLPGAPFSVATYAADIGQAVDVNFFYVFNDQIIDARYQIGGGYFDINVQDQYNGLVSPDVLTRVQNLGGLGGIQFNALPEPDTWALMIGGFVGVGGLLRARRRVAAAA